MKIDTSILMELMKKNLILGFSVEDDEIVVITLNRGDIEKFLKIFEEKGIKVNIIKLSSPPSILSTSD